MAKKPATTKATRTPKKASRKKQAAKGASRFEGLKPNPNKPDAERRENQAKRLGQLLSILERLHGHGQWNLDGLAKELEITPRTVARRLDALKAYGLLLEYDQVSKSYKNLNSIKFPKLNITEDEALGQATATAITQASNLNIGSGTVPVSRKLAAKSSEQIAEILNDGEKLFMVMGFQLGIIRPIATSFAPLSGHCFVPRNLRACTSHPTSPKQSDCS